MTKKNTTIFFPLKKIFFLNPPFIIYCEQLEKWSFKNLLCCKFLDNIFIPKKISQYLQTTFLLYLQRLQVIVPLTFF